MASERDKAKRAIKDTGSADPKLDAALDDAKEQQHKLAVETNRHKEALRDRDLGKLGKFFGGEANAPIYVAAIVVFAGIAGAILSGWMTSQSQKPDSVELWSKMTQSCITVILSGLAYIFGRGSRR